MHTETKLSTLSLPDLWALYTEATGKTTKAPNKKFLVKAILEAQGETEAIKPASERILQGLAAACRGPPELAAR